MKKGILFAITLLCSINIFAEVIVAAERLDEYLPMLKGKKVALVVNQTSIVGVKHLVDVLQENKINVVKLMSPEHGIRGVVSAGELVDHSVDAASGLPIVSLYGNHKKPTSEDLAEVDVIIFDIQDVGVRFYTYISTLTYVMEACAENNKKIIVLDRPNPNGHYVDGPLLEEEYTSFVGLHPVPIVYGMTIGEYAKMVNGEKWMDKGVTCDLTVILCGDYDHNSIYHLPVPPSPNLKTQEAIYLYPSLCFFEGTIISVGRGTDFPFQVYGHPDLLGMFKFTPKSREGAKNPKYNEEECTGEDLRNYPVIDGEINLSWLINAYAMMNKKEAFFTRFFENLAGTASLRRQIIEGKSKYDIKKTWEKDLIAFKKIRAKYLLYKDFETK